MLPHKVPDEIYDDMTNEIDETVFNNMPFSKRMFWPLWPLCRVIFRKLLWSGERKRK